MNYGNMQNMNTAAMIGYPNCPASNQDLVKMNQQKLFNDYVNVGISHRIASGLSGRMSGLITENMITSIQG